jgi:hypothetical protein
VNAWCDAERESWLGAIESIEHELSELHRRHGNATFNESNAKRILEAEERLARVHAILDEDERAE